MMKTILCILLSLSCASAYAGNTCGEWLMGLLDKVSNASMMLKDGITTYEVTYTVVPLPNSKVQSSKRAITFVLGKNLYVCTDDNASVYSDSLNTFTVMNRAKKIVWNESSVFNTEASILQNHRELFKNVVDFACSDYTQGGKAFKKVICTPTEELRKQQYINKIEYIVENEALRSVKLYYEKASGINYIETKYSNMRHTAFPEAYKNGVKASFLTSKGQLLKKYSGYTLDKVNKK